MCDCKCVYLCNQSIFVLFCFKTHKNNNNLKWNKITKIVFLFNFFLVFHLEFNKQLYNRKNILENKTLFIILFSFCCCFLSIKFLAIRNIRFWEKNGMIIEREIKSHSMRRFTKRRHICQKITKKRYIHTYTHNYDNERRIIIIYDD